MKTPQTNDHAHIMKDNAGNVAFTRHVPIRYEADVAVCGAGPAGLIAAIAAARSGARVILIDRWGFAGGNLTAGLVNPMQSFHDREGEQVVRGIAEELVQRIVALGGSPGHVPDPVGFVSTITPFHPEVFKLAADQLLAESGVFTLYHTTIVGVQRRNDEIETLITVNKAGMEGVRADLFIDATGDGDLSALAGEDVLIGRQDALGDDPNDPGDGKSTQAMTLMYRVVGVEWDAIVAEMRRRPDDFYEASTSLPLEHFPVVGVSGFFEPVAEGVAAGQIPAVRDRVLVFGLDRTGDAIVNMTRCVGYSGLSPTDLSAAEVQAREQMWQYFHFLKRRVPGFKKIRLMHAGCHLGIRETRRVLGEYVITAEDLNNGRTFPDAIASGGYPVDIHSGSDAKLITDTLQKPRYQIPLRALMARNNRNLLVCGRCVSSTSRGLAALRVSPIAMAMGEAAGRVAGLAATRRVPIRSVDVADVQKVLDIPT